MAVIRISGNLGAGKSVLGKSLAKILGYNYSSTGDIFRTMAKEDGCTIESFYKKLKSNPQLEKEIDSRQAKRIKLEDNLVVDGRMAPFAECPFQNINILLKVEEAEGARRIWERARNDGNAHSVVEVLLYSQGRAREEKERYRELYGIEDCFAEAWFNIIVDTTRLSQKDVLRVILERLPPLESPR